MATRNSLSVRGVSRTRGPGYARLGHLSRTSVYSILFGTFLNSASLAMRSNIIRELQNILLIMKLISFIACVVIVEDCCMHSAWFLE